MFFKHTGLSRTLYKIWKHKQAAVNFVKWKKLFCYDLLSERIEFTLNLIDFKGGTQINLKIFFKII